MNWIVALGAGAGLGLAHFVGLWVTVTGVVRQPSRAVWVSLSGLARFLILGAGLALLARQGAGHVVVALGGLWLARWYLLQRLGGVSHGQ